MPSLKHGTPSPVATYAHVVPQVQRAALVRTMDVFLRRSAASSDVKSSRINYAVGVPGLTQFAPLLPENYNQLNRLQVFIERFTRPA